MKRAHEDDGDASALALAVRARLMKKPVPSLSASTATTADAASSTSAATSHASLFAKPSSLFKRPSIAAAGTSRPSLDVPVEAGDGARSSTSTVAAPDAASSTSAATSHASLFAKPSSLFKRPSIAAAGTSRPSPGVRTEDDDGEESRAARSSSSRAHDAASSADALHAAAIFGGSLQRREKASVQPPHAAVDAATGSESSHAPLWQSLHVGSECMAMIDGAWRRCKVVSTVHAGYENARYRVAPTSNTVAPRELGVAQLRAVSTTHAARLARGRCRFFDAGTCNRGDRCPYAHVPRD